MDDIGKFQWTLSTSRWVSLDGVPNQVKSGINLPSIDEVLSGEIPLLSELNVRDPKHFKAGGLHENIHVWEEITKEHPQREMILFWIRDGVDVNRFSRPDSGTFKGVHYDSDFSTPRVFKNHGSCKKFGSFIRETIRSRLSAGAVRVWGRVGDTDPPFLVLPITIEPSKPRLCIDARYLNLWMRDSPFALDKLIDVSRYVYRGSYTSPDMITCYSRSRHSNALDSNGVVGGSFARHYRSDGRSLLSFTILSV